MVCDEWVCEFFFFTQCIGVMCNGNFQSYFGIKKGFCVIMENFDSLNDRNKLGEAVKCILYKIQVW